MTPEVERLRLELAVLLVTRGTTLDAYAALRVRLCDAQAAARAAAEKALRAVPLAAVLPLRGGGVHSLG